MKYSTNFLLFAALFGLIISTSLQAQPYGLTTRAYNTSLKVTTSGTIGMEYEVRRVFTHLIFQQPTQITHANDGTSRLFVSELDGFIKVFDADSATQPTLFLNIAAQTFRLMSFAFHPDFKNNGKFYVNYTTPSWVSRISEFTVAKDSSYADPSTERILLTVPHRNSKHTGCYTMFGPDGYLYTAFGYGGDNLDNIGDGQDRTNLRATVIRIDVNTKDPGLEYGIPADNPFVGNSNGWREEIWAYGFRNPWRFSIDSVSNLMWLGDVGEKGAEELNLILPGKNYGWETMEGTQCFDPPKGCNQTGLELPVIEYDQTVGKSITGGFVYRGSRLPSLSGTYIYGDWNIGKIWGLRYGNDTIIEHKLLADTPEWIVSFGEDDTGEVYFLSYFNGQVFVLDEKSVFDTSDNIPQKLSISGLFSDINNKIFSPGLIPYSVNAELWSDGAAKTRYIALPGSSQIEFSLNEAWKFPENTVIVKNFYLDTIKGDVASRKIIETRFLVNVEKIDAWYGLSYMWNDDQRDGILLNNSVLKTYDIYDPVKDTTYRHTHYFPSRTDCNTCHTRAAGHVLGLRTSQMNKSHVYGSVTDNQMRSFNHINLFTTDIGENYANYPFQPDPLDTSYALETRARSYLAANCAQCHLPNGGTRALLDLRFSPSLDSTNTINADPSFGDLTIPGAKIIRVGAPYTSLLYLRMIDNLPTNRMPPLASRIIDTEGSAVIYDWIKSMVPSGIKSDIDSDAKIALLALFPNHPNPFATRTIISFNVSYAHGSKYRKRKVQLNIYDLEGHRLRTLVNDVRTGGLHTVMFDGRDTFGKQLSSGMYVYRIMIDNIAMSRQLMIVR